MRFLALSLSELIKMLLEDVLLIENITNENNAFFKSHLSPKTDSIILEMGRGPLIPGKTIQTGFRKDITWGMHTAPQDYSVNSLKGLTKLEDIFGVQKRRKRWRERELFCAIHHLHYGGNHKAQFRGRQSNI